jgi:hypothetical protein
MKLCWLLLGIAALSLMHFGCGKPDPRTRPGFVDTSDPKEGLKQLNATGKKAESKTPAAKPRGS